MNAAPFPPAVLQAVQSCPFLSKGQRLVYAELWKAGKPMTAGEVNDALGVGFHRRLSELARNGLAAKAPARKCLISGKIVTTWAAVATIPSKDKRTPPPKKAAALQVFAAGSHIDTCLRNFAKSVGWDANASKAERLVTQTDGTWTANLRVGNDTFKMAGRTVPGGVIMTRWE